MLLFFRTRGVRVIFCCWQGFYLTKLYTWLVHATMMPVKRKWNGGLMVVGEICIAINQYLVIFCRLAFLALELEHIVWRLHILDLKRKGGLGRLFICSFSCFFPSLHCFVRKNLFCLLQKIVLCTVLIL